MLFPILLLLFTMTAIWLLYDRQQYKKLENRLLEIQLGDDERDAMYKIGIQHIRMLTCTSFIDGMYKQYEWVCLTGRKRRLRLVIDQGIVVETGIYHQNGAIVKQKGDDFLSGKIKKEES